MYPSVPILFLIYSRSSPFGRPITVPWPTWPVRVCCRYLSQMLAVLGGWYKRGIWDSRRALDLRPASQVAKIHADLNDAYETTSRFEIWDHDVGLYVIAALLKMALVTLQASIEQIWTLVRGLF